MDFSKYTVYTEEEIIDKLKNSLKPSRFAHTLRVSDTAVQIAEAYGYDIVKARLASLLHDNAKYPTDEDILEACNKYGYEIIEEEKLSFSLIHGRLGAVTAAENYGISDPEILNAIRFHTTGRPDMSMLEKIVFVADFIEPGRDFPNTPSLDELRKLVFKDLDLVVNYELVNVIDFIKEKGDYLGGGTKETADYYVNLINQRNKEIKDMAVNTKDMLKLAFKAADDKKAADIRVIDISEISILSEYFLIATGNSAPQVEAIVDNIEEELFKAGYGMPKVEGNKNSGWILLDYSDLIVHVFAKEDREFYDLERLWRDGKMLSSEDVQNL